MPPKTFQDAEVGQPCHPPSAILIHRPSLKSIYDHATNLEFAADFTSAFHLYLEATDVFLRLSRSNATNPEIQAQCKVRAKKAIQRAEKIKQASKTPGAKIGTIAAPIDSFGAGEECAASSM